MMQGKILYSLLAVAMLVGFLSCETDGPDDYKNYFIKYYGGDGYQEAKDFVINDDGTIVMLGTSFESNDITRLYLVKSDAEGNVIWQRKVGSSFEQARDIEPILSGPNQGDFVVLSNVKKNAADSLAIRLTIVSNSTGDSIKSVFFNLLDSQEGYSVTPKADGGFFVVGKTTDPNSEDNVETEFANIEDQLLIQFEPDLTYQPTNVTRIGGSATGAIVKVFGSGPPYFFAGYSDEKNRFIVDDTYESNFFFRSFNVVGTQTQIDYAGSEDEGKNEYMNAIIKSGASYAAIGTRTLTSGAKSIFATSLNSSFKVTEEGIYSASNCEGISISASSSGGYLIAGNQITAGGNRDIWFARINSVDQIDRSNPFTFGAPNNDDMASAIKELSNGDVMILGTMELVNQKKMALIKIRSNGSF
jgi:hypothetical protein